MTGPALTQTVTARDLDVGLRNRLTGPSILAAPQGCLGPVASFAAKNGCIFVDTRNAGGHPLAHTRRVREYRARLALWMRRFHGVATRYLPNYLIWHRQFDHPIRYGPERLAVRWPFGSGFS